METEESVINKSESKLSFEGNEWTLPTDIYLVEPAVEAFVKKLEEAGWNSDEVFDLQLGFSEALSNAIIHGNLAIVKPEGSLESTGELAKKKQKLYATNKKVYVTIDVNRDRVYLKIRDEGKGFKLRGVPDPTLPEGLMKTKGRGLLLMETYFDSVEYLGSGNEVIMSKERKK